ncbi:iron-sulfur cluster carrier protein ApbC, partial [Stenotrophomonas sp. HMWF022]
MNSSSRRPHASQVQKGLAPHARIRNVIAVGSG